MTERDHMDLRLAAGLEQHLLSRVEHDVPATAAVSRRPLHGGPQRTALVTVVVGLAVVLIAVLAIRSGGGEDRSVPADTANASLPVTRTASSAPPDNAALLRRLPKPEYGRVLHTWTEQTPTITGRLSPAGDTVVISAVCTGGGAISYTDVTGKAHDLGCNGLKVQQPFWRFNLGGDDQPTATAKPFTMTVRATKGSPRFIVRVWAVDPRILRSGWYIASTSSAVPRTLRTCAARDLAGSGTFDPLSRQHGGVVTITNRSASDCAIRSWPSMRYLDAKGRQIGAMANMSLDSSEGEENRFHEFPPALLRAGGYGYLIAELHPMQQLDQNDEAQARAEATATPRPSGMPTPEPCDPVRVAALALTVSGSDVIVPIPAKPTYAGCRSEQYSFGVNPVVAIRPDAR